MTIKKNYLMDDDWDFLIVLDACRFDYFSNLYAKYFTGKLEKRQSLGSCTHEWCMKTFNDHYPDVIYISGNPYINSKVNVKGFNGKTHFTKIIDVWEYAWDKKQGTVHPSKLNEATQKAINKFQDQRFIIHYLQPHAPYLSTKFQSNGFLLPEPEQNQVLTGVKGIRSNKFQEFMVNGTGYLFKKFKLIKHEWDLRQKFNLPPATPMDAFKRKWGLNNLKKAYKENLKIVLDHISDLCLTLSTINSSKKIIITSDHGELLGENGDFSHYSRSRNPILIEVPFLKVQKVVHTKPHIITGDAKDTSERLSDTNQNQGESEKIQTTVSKLKNSGKF